MNKILFIGHHRDGTGYSHASNSYALALDSVGVDVVCRNIRFNNVNAKLDDRLEELLKKDSKDCNICLQHSLPTLMQYNSAFKCIGMFATETTFNDTDWATHLNQMDEIWVFSHISKQQCMKSGVTKPIKVIPHTFDLSIYQQSYEPISLPINKDDYVFYFCGEFARKKNIAAIVQAFHIAFHRHEPVQLLLKVNMPGKSADDTVKIVGEFCNEIKAGTKIYNNQGLYKRELILGDFISETEMSRLHKTCHCFIMSSRGEACGIPACEALFHQNEVICTQNIGTQEYLGDEAWYVPSVEDSCFGEINQLPSLYTSNEGWRNINVTELAKTMRYVFDNQNEKKNTGERIYEFSYEKIGNLMKKELGIEG